MATIIKNKSELNKLLKQVSYKMLSDTRNEIFNVIHNSIKEYYSEYNPKLYKRKFRFLNSLVKTEINQNKNEMWCEVKIDEEYLRYTYPDTGLFNPSYPHNYDGRFATGMDVVNWANRKYPDDDRPGKKHGYTKDSYSNSDGFWDGSLEELGDIIQILKRNLKKQGIKVV